MPASSVERASTGFATVACSAAAISMISIASAERLVGAPHRLEILDQIIGDELHVGHRRSARGQSELEQIEIAEIGSSQPPMIVRTNL